MLNEMITKYDDKYCIDFYIQGRIINASNIQNLKLHKLINILNELYQKPNVKTNLTKMRKTMQDLNKYEKLFTDKLKILVSDLDAGDIVKGQCKIGY